MTNIIIHKLLESSSVGSFLVWGGGGQAPQMYQQKKDSRTCNLNARASASETYIFGSQNTCYICIHIRSSRCPCIIAWGYKWQYTDKTLTLRKAMYMRVTGASELRHIFTLLKLIFLSMFGWYFRYFVGTNDMLVGLHVPTNFQMYRQNSEKKHDWGNCPPPPAPPLATLVLERDLSLWEL